MFDGKTNASSHDATYSDYTEKSEFLLLLESIFLREQVFHGKTNASSCRKSRSKPLI